MINPTPYLTFRSALPPAAHALVLAKLQPLDRTAIHEQVPDEPLADPAVWAAVRTMLGPEAVADGCRHIHTSPVEWDGPGPWHVDDYCGNPWPEDNRFVIVSYFPQDTPPELGPTEIRIDGQIIQGGGPAGSYLAMRQDVEHRAGHNLTPDVPRWMIKFLFRDRP